MILVHCCQLCNCNHCNYGVLSTDNTQLYKSNIVCFYLVLLHVSTVYVSHHQGGMRAQKEIKAGEAFHNRQWCKIVQNFSKPNSESGIIIILKLC